MQMILALALVGSAVHAGQAERLRRTAPGGFRQTLHNYQNVQYFADFDIGGQKIDGIFDTGSFELLVRSSRCAHCVHPTPPYEHDHSKSYSKNGTMVKHVFGSGPCISMKGYETVSVGPSLRAEGQSFWEIVDHRIDVLNTAKFAAIVGIGPNFEMQNNDKTLLSSFGVTAFSICLRRPSGSNGYLTWGEPVVKTGRITAKVYGKHHWGTHMTDVSFDVPGGKSQALCGSDQPCTAILDSGTSLIAAPGFALMALSDQIPEIAEDCSNLDALPMLKFMVDGHPFVLPPQAYVMRVTGAVMDANSIWDILFFKPKIRKLDMCMPAFMQMDMMSQHGPVWILGMPFFRYFHTTFDRTERAMHIARAGPDCEALPLGPAGGNASGAFLAVDREAMGKPMDVDVDAIIPPTLSGQMDFPFGNMGELDL